ncbi:hypothetical protein ACUXIS_005584 [Cytobacillus horneckiae]
MIYYICEDCDEAEFLLDIVPKKKCPCCKKYMEAIEE